MRGEQKDNQKFDDNTVAREIMEWIVSIIVAVALVLVIHNYIGQLVRVDGASMQPTLYTDQRVLVTKIPYWNDENIERGDIVITKFPGSRENFVKRIIALPGDRIRVTDGVLYINDIVIDEPYIKETMYSDYTETTVPEGYYFVMGDNRNNSKDSRSSAVGALPREMIQGRAYAILWPFVDFKVIEHKEYTELN
ncbi:MAG: signal peptidase I [Clostridia bacterium]|nr:signal peptidase I [Clostridia bacterium]